MTTPALIAIDFINDIIHPQGKIPSCADHIASQNALVHVNNAIAIARKKGWPVIFVTVGFSHNYAQLPSNSPIFKRAKEFGALEIGKWGTELHGDIKKEENDPVVIKHRISSFHGTNLEVILKAKNIDTLVIAGVSTEMAIQAITREAHDRDYNLFILEDCCASHTADSHVSSLQVLTRLAKIVKSTEMDSIM